MFLEIKLRKGFTLLEMMVSVTIISLITAVTLYNYSTFNDNLALSSAAQELAITIRQAQAYGLAVKESASGSDKFTYAYGVYLNKSTAPSNYFLFVDSSIDNFVYDGVTTGCKTTVECIEKSMFRNGVVVSEICGITNGSESCFNFGSIAFKRPNPDAKINIGDNEFDTGRIQLKSRRNSTIEVKVESTGQVLVGGVK